MTNQEYEAEIARLTQGYEDLRNLLEEYSFIDAVDEFDKGWNKMASLTIKQINKITGGGE